MGLYLTFGLRAVSSSVQKFGSDRCLSVPRRAIQGQPGYPFEGGRSLRVLIDSSRRYEEALHRLLGFVAIQASRNGLAVAQRCL